MTVKLYLAAYTTPWFVTKGTNKPRGCTRLPDNNLRRPLTSEERRSPRKLLSLPRVDGRSSGISRIISIARHADAQGERPTCGPVEVGRHARGGFNSGRGNGLSERRAGCHKAPGKAESVRRDRSRSSMFEARSARDWLRRLHRADGRGSSQFRCRWWPRCRCALIRLMLREILKLRNLGQRLLKVDLHLRKNARDGTHTGRVVVEPHGPREVGMGQTKIPETLGVAGPAQCPTMSQHGAAKTAMLIGRRLPHSKGPDTDV